MSVTESFANWVSEHFQWMGILIFVFLGAWQIAWRNHRDRLAKKVLNQTILSNSHEPFTLHPEVNPSLCAGCGACTRVCPEGDILKLIDHKAVLVQPTRCVGHGECEIACPTSAISLVFGTKTRGMDIPRLTQDYETNFAGLYIAGELGGMGLVRNAIKQGHLAAQHAISQLKRQSKSEQTATDLDLLIVGAGPAGLSAALTAADENISYLMIEQNSFGGTVANYPRQKIVSTHPLELPGVGLLRFQSNQISKYDLLEKWESIRVQKRLKVREGVRFETLKKEGNAFQVKTSEGQIHAKKVILCLGVRGTPKRLGLKNEDSPKVVYHLLDPNQYVNQQIAIVGGGNSAAEAAISLSQPDLKNHVVLLVRGSSLDRCTQKNQEQIHLLESQDRLQVRFRSEVQQIEKDHLVIHQDHRQKSISNDYLFILAGTEMPFSFLMSLGVKIDKRFGEVLRKN